MIDSHILDITEGHDEDDSIRSCQYHQYSPITGTQLNQPGEIRITIGSGTLRKSAVDKRHFHGQALLRDQENLCSETKCRKSSSTFRYS